MATVACGCCYGGIP